MRLVLIRHAIAVPSGTPGIADDERPLTPRGRRRFAAAAAGLAQLVSAPDLILTSPLPRAHHTARLAAEAWRLASVRDEPVLAGHDFDAWRALIDGTQAAVVALVGHEPSLSQFLAALLGSRDAARFAFKKGGAALVELEATTPARLLGFWAPRVLRAAGR